MPWHNPLTWTIGQILTAAQMNEQLRDNMQMTATGIVAQPGDTVYATGPNALTRLGIGATNKRLGVAGGAPTWVDACDTLGPAVGTSNVTLDGTARNIPGVTVTLTAGKWMVFGKFAFTIGAGDGGALFTGFLNATGATGSGISITPVMGSNAGQLEVSSTWLVTTTGGVATLQMQKIGGTGTSQANTNSSLLAVRIGG